MVDKIRNYTHLRPKTRKCIGVFFVIFGFVTLVTPFTPGGILFFVGLEFLGVRLIDGARVKRFFARKPALEHAPVETTS